MEKKSIKDLTKEEKEQFTNELFNRSKVEYHEITINEDDYFRDTKLGTFNIKNEDIVNKIKEAFDEEKIVRFNLEENLVLIQK